jgi:hypothetical protein
MFFLKEHMKIKGMLRDKYTLYSLNSAQSHTVG